MTVKELANAMNFSAVAIPDADREVSGAYVGDLLSWVMGRAESANAWITIMSNVNVLAVATLTDVSCVIFAEGVIPDGEIIDTANTKGINLLSSSLSSYETAVLISGSV